MDDELRCRFCRRYVIDGLYVRVSFPDGIANVCDLCMEQRAEPSEDIVVWRNTEVEVA